MRLFEFAKDSVLTNVGITSKKPKPVEPDGYYSPLGTDNEKPIPLTANAAVEVDKSVESSKVKNHQ